MWLYGVSLVPPPAIQTLWSVYLIIYTSNDKYFITNRIKKTTKGTKLAPSPHAHFSQNDPRGPAEELTGHNIYIYIYIDCIKKDEQIIGILTPIS